MRRAEATATKIAVAFCIWGASVYGCAPEDGAGRGFPFTTGGASGSPTGTGGNGSGGSGPGDAAPGDAGPGGSGGAETDAGTVGIDDPITRVVPTPGCGKDPGQEPGIAVRGTVQTMGTKPADAADSKKGDWSYEREYFVTLPVGYLRFIAHPLVLQGPGCGGKGTSVIPIANSVDNTVIRVGLTPPPNDIGHATNPGQGCFDDKEGDHSVDWVFYENLYDKLAQQVCFDRNRVFVSGNSSGAWLANELACKYAGDATRPIRGLLSNTGGLPTEAGFVLTCPNKPFAGMWIHQIVGGELYFANSAGITRAMQVNGCTGGTNYDDAMTDSFSIGGGNPSFTCRAIRGCPTLYPLVVCPLPSNGAGSADSVTNPAFATFIKLFLKAPLLFP